MILALMNRIRRLDLTEHQFFKIAHQWSFNHCPPELTQDVLDFKEKGVVPKYVELFVQHLEQSK